MIFLPVSLTKTLLQVLAKSLLLVGLTAGGRVKIELTCVESSGMLASPIGGQTSMRLMKIKDQPVELTAPKSWLLGYIAGDVHVRAHKELIGTSGDPDEAALLVEHLQIVYGPTATVTELPPGKGKRTKTNYRVVLTRRLVVDDVSSFGSFGIAKWRVPERVLNASPEIRAAWVSGFADADGCADLKGHRVLIYSTNGEGLTQVQDILTSLGIRVHRGAVKASVPGRKDGWTLRVSSRHDLQSFEDLVGFKIPRKKAKLRATIESIGKTQEFSAEIHGKEVSQRRVEGQTYAEIALALGVHDYEVKDYCRDHEIKPSSDLAKGRAGRALPRILELKREGKTNEEVASLLGLEATHVGHALRKHAEAGGEKFAQKTRTLASSTRDYYVQAAALKAQGKSYEEIGVALGHSERAAAWTKSILARGRKARLEIPFASESGIPTQTSGVNETWVESPVPLPPKPPATPRVYEAPSFARLPEVLALKAEGLSAEEISAKLEYGKGSTVLSLISRAVEKGLIERSQHGSTQRLNYEEIKARRAAGEDWQTIGEALCPKKHTGAKAARWAVNTYQYGKNHFAESNGLKASPVVPTTKAGDSLG